MSELIAGIKKLSEDSKQVWQDICDKGLEKYVAQLDAVGYAVIPPEVVAAPEGDVEEARRLAIELAKEQGAEDINYASYEEGLSYEMYHLARHGEVFERFLINPTIMTIGKYLLGKNMVLGLHMAYIKAKNDKYLAIHSDSLTVPDPLPDYRHLINVTIPLTDYTKEAGCLGIVPGSHKLRRHPTTPEKKYFESMEPIECPAGSVIIIPGNTWHGSFPKQDDNLRVTLVQGYSRQYFARVGGYKVDPEIIKRNPPEFAQLFGSHLFSGDDGFDEDGFDPELQQQNMHSQLSHYS